MTNELDKRAEDWLSDLCWPIIEAKTDALFMLLEWCSNLSADERPRLLPIPIDYALLIADIDEPQFRKALYAWRQPNHCAFREETLATLRYDADAWKCGAKS